MKGNREHPWSRMSWLGRTALAFAVLPALATPVAAQGRGNLTPEQMEERRRAAAEALRQELAQPRPIEAHNSVWIEELTWMEVRDAIAEGKTTALISTGGIEQNGPYLATGKHNYVLKGACEAIARELGNALCAPIIKLVPEGSIDEPSGHMRYPGTISLREETFRAVLEDVGRSLKAHGFTNIVYFGDSGGNQGGMEAVAAALNERWDDATAHFIPEFYRYRDVFTFMEEELGIAETESDGLHDDFVITALMMTVDPTSVRFDERVSAGLATINGVSISPLADVVATGERLMRFRADQTAAAIRESIGRR